MLKPFLICALLWSGTLCAQENENHKADGLLVATGQRLHPAGERVIFNGRALDLERAPDGQTIFVKNIYGLTLLDAQTWKVRQELKFNRDVGGSMHGLCVSRQGLVYLSTTDKTVQVAQLGADGKAAWVQELVFPPPPFLANSRNPKTYPCGLALSPDEKMLYVCLSRSNTLAVMNLESGKVEAEIETGIAPYAVLVSPDGQTAYVSNWGGRKPKKGELTGKASGSEMLVDTHGAGVSGTVMKIELAARKVLGEIETGLHPSGLALTKDGSRLGVANASSDTVALVDTAQFKVLEKISTRPDEKLLFGSIPNAVAFSADAARLYVANGGNNAVAVIELAQQPGQKSVVSGFIPTGWFPSSVLTGAGDVLIACAKGDGQPYKASHENAYKVTRHRGGVCKVNLPDEQTLKKYTQTALEDAQVALALRAAEQGGDEKNAVPLPKKAGDPSTIKHVVYILKENRTYDQVFGDLEQGNGMKELCTYGREVTPNHHALAEQFVLLDNYYCNGVVSADGHQWATQGVVTDGAEKSFGGFTRSYDFGSDAMTIAPSGFLWDNALLHGLTFRNYGEFDFPTLEPKCDWFQCFQDHQNGMKKVKCIAQQRYEPLKPYTCADFPGWNLAIPDSLRTDVFLREFEEYQKKGEWPNLVLIYLPQDHTSGDGADSPSPRAMVADNDLALGRIVEAITKSKFWPETCIFVNEDDAQNGLDHVDGHRSLCLVVSPYSKRKQVVSTFYNQTSVLHTMELMLGLPPMNQNDAFSPAMYDCFVNKPDLTPFDALKNNIALDEPNGKHGRRTELEHPPFDLTRPDRIDEDAFNRVLWKLARGDERYPVEFAGPHGRGLKQLKLMLDKSAEDDDDDDDDAQGTPQKN